MARPVIKIFIGFAVAAVLLAAAILFALSRPSSPPPALPNPNGYDDLIKASAMLAGDVSDWPNLNEADLAAAVAANTAALKLLRVGLTKECRVPVDFSARDGMSPNFTNLAGLKSLAQALAAEGRLAEIENRPGDALESYVTAIRFGGECGRGGVVIDSLVAIAVEAIGTVQLEKLEPKLDLEQCRETANTLEAVLDKMESPATVLKQEKAWIARTYSLKWRLVALVQFKTTQVVNRRYISRVKAHQGRLRTLIVSLASRAYALDKGTPPKTEQELVPGYLKALPADPYAQTDDAPRGP